jgi:hypothetical protein
VQRTGYLEEFTAFWSAREETRRLWFSLFTPQQGHDSEERLRPADRQAVVSELARLRVLFPKIHLPNAVLEGYRNPPQSPHECIFARTTTCISADLTTRIEPCQFGGDPVCTECGCIASAGLASIGKYKLGGLVRVGKIFDVSDRIGQRVNAVRAGASAGASAASPVGD